MNKSKIKIWKKQSDIFRNKVGKLGPQDKKESKIKWYKKLKIMLKKLKNIRDKENNRRDKINAEKFYYILLTLTIDYCKIFLFYLIKVGVNSIMDILQDKIYNIFLPQKFHYI